MKLIVNADDFGLSRGVNYGIIDAFLTGAVKSATMMANMPGLDHAVGLAQQSPGLGIGVHLTLTSGKALSEKLTTLTDDQGIFWPQRVLMEKLRQGQIIWKEVEQELIFQIERVIQKGIKITHLDSHHHVHQWDGITAVVSALASQYGLPVRRFSNQDAPLFAAGHPQLAMPDVLITDFYGNDLNEDCFIDLIKCYKGTDKIVEVMSHPAYLDQALIESSGYHMQRAGELAVLTSPRVMNYIRESQIELANFNVL